MAEIVEVLAPAKINLVLEVGKRRVDGFHQLATIFQSVALHDRLRFTSAVDEAGLIVKGPQMGELAHLNPEKNLAWRAAVLLAEAIGREAVDVKICLEKQIPIAAGLGGGSSDAAAVLRALGKQWAVDDPQLLWRLASELGSDVAFFLQNGVALGEGRGEILAPVNLPQMWVVLANPGFVCSTAAVFKRHAVAPVLHKKPLGERCRRLVRRLQAGGPIMASADLWQNDLAAAALAEVPAMQPIMNTFFDLGALAAQVSGSGATVFAVARDAEHAQAMHEGIAPEVAWSWWGPTIAAGGN